MADKNINISLTAEDNASATVAKVATKSKGSLEAVKKFGAGAGRAFEAVGKGAVFLNQGAELFKKFAEMGLKAVEMTRQYVSESSPLMQNFKESSNAVKGLSAGIGVVLIKAFNAVVKAIQPAIEGFKSFIQTNQNIIGLKIVEYLEMFAKGTLVAVAKGLVLVSKISSGWAMIIDALKIGVNSMFSTLLSHVANALDGMASLAELVGMDGLAGKIKQTREQAKGLGETFADSANESSAALEQTIRKQEEFEAAVERNGQAVYKAIGEVAVNAAKAFTGEVVIGNQTLEEREALLASQEEAAAKRAEAEKERREQAAEARAKFAEETKLAQETERARIESLANEYGALGSSIGGAFMSGYGAAQEGQDAVAEGFKSMTASIIDEALAAMQKFITIKAAEGAANAAAGSAMGGPLIAAAMAGIVFSLIRGFIGKAFQGMADGGIVRGGTPGHDSVPIMAQAGEMVLTTDQVDRLRTGGGIGGGGEVKIELNSQIPAGRAELKKYVRQNIVPALKDLKMQGMI